MQRNTPIPLSASSPAPKKPQISAELSQMLDRFASVPSQRNGPPRFLLIGKPYAGALELRPEHRRQAVDLLAQKYYRRASQADLAGALGNMAFVLVDRRHNTPVIERIAELFHHELRVVPRWLLGQAARGHLKTCKWFPTLAELLQQAREIRSDVMSECERLWWIVEAA